MPTEFLRSRGVFIYIGLLFGGFVGGEIDRRTSNRLPRYIRDNSSVIERLHDYQRNASRACESLSIRRRKTAFPRVSTCIRVYNTTFLPMLPIHANTFRILK